MTVTLYQGHSVPNWSPTSPFGCHCFPFSFPGHTSAFMLALSWRGQWGCFSSLVFCCFFIQNSLILHIYLEIADCLFWKPAWKLPWWGEMLGCSPASHIVCWKFSLSHQTNLRAVHSLLTPTRQAVPFATAHSAAMVSAKACDRKPSIPLSPRAGILFCLILWDPVFYLQKPRTLLSIQIFHKPTARVQLLHELKWVLNCQSNKILGKVLFLRTWPIIICMLASLGSTWPQKLYIVRHEFKPFPEE